MKLSFSTLGCPRWTFSEIISTAKDLCFDGIEIRGIGDTLNAPEIAEFADDKIESTKETLRKLNLSVPILTSAATLASDENAQASVFEACKYIELASRLGVPYIRVMGTGDPHISAGNFKMAAGLYRQICSYGASLGVTPLIETNGALSSSEAMRRFLDRAESENSGVLWDVHHTVRFGEEKPVETFANIGHAVRHVHLKDSLMKAGKVKYQMMGYGDIPFESALALLNCIKYDGFVSLEWVKRWNPDLQEPGIVFAQYKSYMDSLSI